MKLWQQLLGARIVEVKANSPDIAYEQVGQRIREELRNQPALDFTENMVLNKLEDQIPGKLGAFIGTVYRTYLKTKTG